jgi:hypothetical protein
MRFLTILSLFSALASFSLMAETVENYRKFCEDSSLVEQLGSAGSCQTLIIPAENPDKVITCLGKYGGFICETKFIVNKGQVASIVNCNNTESVLEAEVLNYRVAYLLTDSNGLEKLEADKLLYSNYSNRFITLNVIEDNEGLVKAEMSFNMQSIVIPFEEISCE